jgi:hypothetical protein
MILLVWTDDVASLSVFALSTRSTKVELEFKSFWIQMQKRISLITMKQFWVLIYNINSKQVSHISIHIYICIYICICIYMYIQINVDMNYLRRLRIIWNKPIESTLIVAKTAAVVIKELDTVFAPSIFILLSSTTGVPYIYEIGISVKQNIRNHYSDHTGIYT